MSFAFVLGGPLARAATLATERTGKALSPWDELTTEPSVVVHAKSGRRLTYGEIAAFAQVPDKPPEIKPEQLKKPSQFRLIGKDVIRVDVPGKVNGSARYAIAGARNALRRGATRAG